MSNVVFLSRSLRTKLVRNVSEVLNDVFSKPWFQADALWGIAEGENDIGEAQCNTTNHNNNDSLCWVRKQRVCVCTCVGLFPDSLRHTDRQTWGETHKLSLSLCLFWQETNQHEFSRVNTPAPGPSFHETRTTCCQNNVDVQTLWSH